MATCGRDAVLLKMVLFLCKGKKAGQLDLCIRKELLVCFTGSEDGIKISMREEDASPDEVMRWLFRILLDSLDLFLSDMIASKLLNKFVVIDFLVGAAGNRIGIDHEIVLLFLHLFHNFLLDFLLHLCLGFGLCLFHQL